MARKRRPPPAAAPATASAPAAAAKPAAASAGPTPPTPPPGGASLPAEVTAGDWTAALFALMMFLAPALGVPSEEMLQDTLKSIVVSMTALGAAFLFFLQQRGRREPLRWHGLMWLPILLLAYALGSMAWSHAYLAGVEAVRWFVFALLLWLGLNTLSRERLPWLAWGIHAGAVVASLWTALQFWVDLPLFPQGPNPASTFVNRNFFSEFAVCTLPFSWLLLARARRSGEAVALALTNAFVVIAIFMTGTRSALVAMWLLFLLVLPLIAWKCRAQLPWRSWSRELQAIVAVAFFGTVVGLGAIPSGNQKILDENRGRTPLELSVRRTQSIGPQDSSLSIRKVMWRATTHLLRDRPVFGVGAGAWENEIPLYQAEGSQLETDYYAHNEFLQLLAEYGLVGWIFLALLAAYLIAAAWRAWVGRTPQEEAERPWRAVLLGSLLALMVVSNIGFPWRMATTGALFALCLAALAASDARLRYHVGHALATRVRWSPAAGNAAVAATLACIALALYITQQASESERKIVRAAKMAISITGTNDPNNPNLAAMKGQMLQLVREGIAINPHYRKITPMVADELARWGDWKNATWIWESVLSSRPNVVAIIANVARGYSSIGDQTQAMAYLERAKRIQPRAPAVRSLEVVLLSRAGQEAKALQLAKQAVVEDMVDYDLANALFILAWRAKDYPLALSAMELRMLRFPETRARGYMQLGMLYGGDLQQPAKAIESFRQGLALARSPGERAMLQQQVPPQYQDQVRAAASLPAATSQTSANSR